MNSTLLKSLIALAPTGVLFLGSTVLYAKRRTRWSILQVAGAGCLMVVILAHVSEGLHWFPWMRWGAEDSVGHYLDLSSAALGLSLFPIGYLLHACGAGSEPR
jgi:hypothetical protein